jgi:aspartyl/glutamyl-tRNA(Asn/Gln) amidotransferase C subunit
MAYATAQKNIFREDKQESSFPRQKILELSPSSSNGFFKVPKVLE